MAGENIVDDTCWIVKSHHPHPKFPHTAEFDANKIVVCVRNPFDTIYSYAHFANTAYTSQSAQIDNDIFKEDPKFTKDYIDIVTMNLYHFFVHIHSCYEDKKVPIYFIKFEELRSNPKPVLTDLFKFLLNLDSLEGTIAEKRIEEALDLGHGATQLYKVKDHDN